MSDLDVCRADAMQVEVGRTTRQLVVANFKVLDLTAKLAAAEAEMAEMVAAMDQRDEDLEAKLAKATAVVEAAEKWRKSMHAHHETGSTTDDELNEWHAERSLAQQKFWHALANYHAGPTETETPD